MSRSVALRFLPTILALAVGLALGLWLAGPGPRTVDKDPALERSEDLNSLAAQREARQSPFVRTVSSRGDDDDGRSAPKRANRRHLRTALRAALTSKPVVPDSEAPEELPAEDLQVMADKIVTALDAKLSDQTTEEE